MSPLPGFRRVPGRSERYIPPPNWRGKKAKDGTISRRQYENYRLKMEGWKTWSEYQRDADTDDYRRWKGEFAAKHVGTELTSVGPHSEFAAYWLEAKRSGWSKDADGPFADLLVLTGHREPEWEWDVGDTNPQ